MRPRILKCTLALLSLATIGSPLRGAVPARLYDFEEGLAGGTADAIADTITELFNPAPAVDGSVWLDIPGEAGRPLPAGLTKDIVDETARAAPPLNEFMGAITFTDVSDGSAMDSPSPGSSIAGSFDGMTVYDDFDKVTGLGGSRGVYVSTAAYENNDPVDASESFSMMTQAWVRPDSSAMGTVQTVWQMGAEQGKIQITDDAVPVWSVDNLGSAGVLTGDNPIPVAFDEWTHIAVFRGGNGAELFINGTFVAGDRNPSPANWFNTFSKLLSVGADEFGSDGFTGLIDDFVLSGFGDGSLSTADLTYCDAFPGTAECPVIVPTLTCDFDGDGDCDFGDIDDLYANFGTASATHDLNGDGTVSASDIGDWLSAASEPENAFNTTGATYVLGDVNLDGVVDSTDLGLMLNNFGDTGGMGFGAGNINDDPNIDSTDLGLLLNNFGAGSGAASSAAVPEPAFGGWLLLLVMTGLASYYRRRQA